MVWSFAALSHVMAITYSTWSDMCVHGRKCRSYLVLNSIVLEGLNELGHEVLPSVHLVKPVFMR